MNASIDPVMARFRAALDAAYGDRIERVVLFGSRARGDAQADSDYDVAVFLKDMQDFGREMRTIARLGVEFLDDDGAVINALPFREGAYRSRTAFMSEVRRDGRDL
jgi:predicted nucleotidyltransferase